MFKRKSVVLKIKDFPKSRGSAQIFQRVRFISCKKKKFRKGAQPCRNIAAPLLLLLGTILTFKKVLSHTIISK